MHHQVLIDDRPIKEKEKDYLHEELALSSIPVEYLTRVKAKKQIGKYFAENQGNVGSCCGHGTALAGGILKVREGKPYQRLSPAFIYRQRKNYPNEGMYVVDAGDILKKNGSCLETYCPTPHNTVDMDNLFLTGEMYDKAKPFRAGSYFALGNKIDDYANIANNLELPIILFVWGSVKEWSMETPEILDENLTLENAPIRHLVTILPNTAHIYKKKKYVIIQDSAHFGKKTHRYVSEDWFNKRVVMGQYWLTLDNAEPTPPPLYDFKVNLKVGDTGEEVRRMQEFLKSQGFFPDMPCTGYYGGISRKAVEDFQIKYSNKILAFFGLTKPTGYWGEKTREMANNIINGNL